MNRPPPAETQTILVNTILVITELLHFPALPCAGNRFVGRENDGDMRGNPEEMGE